MAEEENKTEEDIKNKIIEGKPQASMFLNEEIKSSIANAIKEHYSNNNFDICVCEYCTKL